MSGGGKPPARPRKPKAGLTMEEQDLWDHAAASMKPLRRAKGRILDGADEAVFEPVEVRPKRRAKASSDAHPKPVAIGGARAAGGMPAVVALPKSLPGTPPLTAFDRKSARRIRSGQIDIDARIDLHGMHQGEAHAALRRFLFSCHANSARWVLVITGKGAPRRAGWFTDDGEPDVRGGLDRHEPRGVLRRNVPRWLAEPDLRAIVVSYTQAAISHGGEGAIYVQLRRR